MVTDPNHDHSFADAALWFFTLLLTCIAVYGLLWCIDFLGVPNSAPHQLLGQKGVMDVLANFGEVALGILGVAVTVVAIIVELAANRYTPRITEMFVRDPLNVTVLGFFLVTAVMVLWVSMSLYGPIYPANMVRVATGAMTLSLLLLLPYFGYVFDFLHPTRVVHRITVRCTRAIDRLSRQGLTGVPQARHELMNTVEQLGDIALNSIEKRDKAISITSVDALSTVLTHHLGKKTTLPLPWYDSEQLVRTDQDFVAFHPDIIRALTDRRTWVEMKVLRQYQAVFGASLNRMQDVGHLIAIRTRQFATLAVAEEDTHAVTQAIRFLNTYIRGSINNRDVRTAYNLMNEYRVFAEELVRAKQSDLAVEVAEYLKFYGQLAFSAKIPFILESAAYDLCGLLEIAHQQSAPSHDRLLEVFLDVDREPLGEATQEASLRGVRKAQIKLATHYLARGSQHYAQRIFDDMRDEQPVRLQSILAELQAVKEAEFWEVSDRGINFEYLPPEQRRELDTFFGWFKQ
ncbi:MAG: DUF2254 domain-containing protein [Proteobacteria bacterium]|nr:DUF2254 domain-containing protein [Pseudomonadota bacterium]